MEPEARKKRRQRRSIHVISKNNIMFYPSMHARSWYSFVYWRKSSSDKKIGVTAVKHQRMGCCNFLKFPERGKWGQSGGAVKNKHIPKNRKRRTSRITRGFFQLHFADMAKFFVLKLPHTLRYIHFVAADKAHLSVHSQWGNFKITSTSN